MKEQRIVLLCFGIFMLFLIINAVFKNRSISENQEIGVAKIYNLSYSHYKYYADYSFSYNGKWFKGSKSLPGGRKDENYLKRYFIVEFAKGKPTLSNLLFNKEVKDSLKIVKAGFKLSTNR